VSGELVPVLFANLCGGIFVLILLAFGIYLVVFSIRSKKKTEESQNWPSTTGTVTLAEVKRSVNRDEDGNESYAYFPKVEYSYQVGGETLTGNRLAFGGVLAQSNPAPAQKTLERYPLDGQVTVYYDPEKPSDAVLERKAGGMKWGLIVGIMCLALSLCIACVLLIALIRNLPSM
jgi:hypothetical protein